MKYPAGPRERFAPGTIEIVEIADRSIGIVNAEGTLYAVLNVCPHALAPVCRGWLTGTLFPSTPFDVQYGLENRVLRCPWHKYEFDLAAGGRAVFTGYRGRLKLYPLTIEDGQVMVEITAERP
jgi:nitrite reductase/ring-hydroxylating ferredoxin subunit